MQIENKNQIYQLRARCCFKDTSVNHTAVQAPSLLPRQEKNTQSSVFKASVLKAERLQQLERSVKQIKVLLHRAANCKKNPEYHHKILSLTQNPVFMFWGLC